MPRAHDIGQSEKRAKNLVRVISTGDFHQRAFREGHTHLLGLASESIPAEEATVQTCGLEAGFAVGADPTAERKRGDHEVALGERLDGGAGLLHHADELVTDRAHVVRRLAPVVPHTQARTTRTTASVGSTMWRSGTFATPISRGPLKTAACMKSFLVRLFAAIQPRKQPGVRDAG